jgi:uncharacterized protein involved in type VI secretion and phage assembly
MSDSGPKFYGKYRGMVISNIDPMQIGRLLVQVPDVTGLAPSSWAMPCFPFSGKQMGAWGLPQIGTGVWVEFEQGNADHPIWSGCWFGSPAEVPALALAAPPGISNVVLQTTGALISVSDVGITISNGKGAMIVMAGPTVTINSGALIVT